MSICTKSWSVDIGIFYSLVDPVRKFFYHSGIPQNNKKFPHSVKPLPLFIRV